MQTVGHVSTLTLYPLYRHSRKLLHILQLVPPHKNPQRKGLNERNAVFKDRELFEEKVKDSRNLVTLFL